MIMKLREQIISIVLMQIILRDRSVEIEQWNYFLAFKYHNKRMESF